MKVSAFRNKETKFTAELWTYTSATDTEGGVIRTYSRNRNITFSCVTGNFGKVDAYFSDSEADVLALDQLKSFRGPDGNELVITGVWQVELIAPFINLWGHREGFRARLAVIGTQS